MGHAALTGLEGLPPELLDLILGELDNIDDLLSLGCGLPLIWPRVCRFVKLLFYQSQHGPWVGTNVISVGEDCDARGASPLYPPCLLTAAGMDELERV
jgi:hypothetical protein